jgi:dTDP-4-amino-4,6-dideoxygalactose transaminase
LPHLNRWNDARRTAAQIYLEGLQNLPGLTLPHVPEWAQPVWHLFVVRCARRDALQVHLRSLGIDTAIHYPIPPHLQGAYRGGGFAQASLDVALAWSREALSLPMWPGVPAERVVSAVHRFFLDSAGATP